MCFKMAQGWIHTINLAMSSVGPTWVLFSVSSIPPPGLVYGAAVAESVGLSCEGLDPSEVLFYYSPASLAPDIRIRDHLRSHYPKQDWGPLADLMVGKLRVNVCDCKPWVTTRSCLTKGILLYKKYIHDFWKFISVTFNELSNSIRIILSNVTCSNELYKYTDIVSCYRFGHFHYLSNCLICSSSFVEFILVTIFDQLCWDKK